jgi:hypothetical protein
MLAHAFLVVTALIERTHRPPPSGLAPLTCNEIQHLFAALVARPVGQLGHRLRWSCGGDDIKPTPVPAITDDRPPGHHEDHDLRLECKPARLVASHLPSNAKAGPYQTSKPRLSALGLARLHSRRTRRLITRRRRDDNPHQGTSFADPAGPSGRRRPVPERHDAARSTTGQVSRLCRQQRNGPGRPDRPALLAGRAGGPQGRGCFPIASHPGFQATPAGSGQAPKSGMSGARGYCCSAGQPPCYCSLPTH